MACCSCFTGRVRQRGDRGRQPLARHEPQVVRLEIRRALLDQHHVLRLRPSFGSSAPTISRAMSFWISKMSSTCAVVGLREQMKSALHIDELRRDPQLLTRTPHAPFQHVPHVQRVADLAHRHALAVEAERRGARRDVEALDRRECVQQLFGDPIPEVLLVVLRAHVHERQHRDRRRRRWLRRSRQLVIRRSAAVPAVSARVKSAAHPRV